MLRKDPPHFPLSYQHRARKGTIYKKNNYIHIFRIRYAHRNGEGRYLPLQVIMTKLSPLFLLIFPIIPNNVAFFQMPSALVRLSLSAAFFIQRSLNE